MGIIYFFIFEGAFDIFLCYLFRLLSLFSEFGLLPQVSSDLIYFSYVVLLQISPSLNLFEEDLMILIFLFDLIDQSVGRKGEGFNIF